MSTILIGVDASERSEDAIAFGSQLAQASGASVVVANACREPLRDRSLEIARALCDRLDLPEGRALVKIATNVSPAHALHSMAEGEDAALVIVGSTHTGRAGRVFPGSTGERLLDGAPCAVAVVPDRYRERVGPIGVVGAAYDGTPEARAAVRAAAELARGFDAELVVIGVVVPGAYDLDGAVDGHSIVRDVREELDAIVEELPGATATLLTGDAAELLAEHSRHVDLLVTGSRGYGPVRAVLAGGVSGRLLRSAHCPVVVVPRGVEAPLGRLFAPELAERAVTRLLIGYDGSESARAAILVARALFGPADATVAHVHPPPPTVASAGIARAALPQAVITEGVTKLRAEVEAEARAITDAGVEFARTAGLGAEPSLRFALTPWRELLEVAAESDADAIVCGTAGEGPIERAVLGSTASSLLYHADRPLLVVPGGVTDVAGPVLAGYDGSDGARAALRFAAAGLSRSRLLVAHAVDSRSSERGRGGGRGGRRVRPVAGPRRARRHVERPPQRLADPAGQRRRTRGRRDARRLTRARRRRLHRARLGRVRPRPRGRPAGARRPGWVRRYVRCRSGRRRAMNNARVESWDASYVGGPAPWDIDRPQPAFARLAEAGAFTGAVLDAGCGTGEHALLLAARGLSVLGVDVAPTAIARAREKAAARGLDVEFQVGDALHLSGAFDTVLDCGLFHTFDADERRAYVASLAAVTRGRLFVLCFGEADVPHPVTEAELRAAFADGWHIASLVPDVIVTRFAPAGVPAWLATIERT